MKYIQRKGNRIKSSRLKQWKGQLPKGTEVTLVSQYRNYDVVGVIK